MTSRERWLAVLQRQTPDRVPMDYWATDEATAKLMAHLGCASMDEVGRRLHLDIPLAVGGRYVGPEPPSGEDIWGCKRRDVDYGSGVYGEVTHHPLARYETLAELKADYHWPAPDWWDYSHLPEQIRGKEPWPIRGGGSEPFLLYCALRGQELASMDMILRPEMVHSCLDRLFELAYQSASRVFDQIPRQVTFRYVVEDMGSQESLLFSKTHIHEFLIPGMKRIMDLVHSAGAYVFHHSDGAVRPIIPDMIGAGIDILNPVQWHCKGMEREGLKADFGDQVIFHGAVGNQ